MTPLAAPSLCFDLRRGCSLVEHLVTGGRPTYLVEYGQVSFKDRNLGMEHWVTEVVPEAVRQVSRHAGGRPVHVVGWSLGGIFALLTAAAWPTLPIASVTTVGAPIDVEPGAADRAGAPVPRGRRRQGRADRARLPGHGRRRRSRWCGRAFQLSAFNKLVTKPFVQLANLDDADFLAQLEAVDRFTANMIAYPGRTFGQLYHRMVRDNELASGTVHYRGSRHLARRHHRAASWRSAAPRHDRPGRLRPAGRGAGHRRRRGPVRGGARRAPRHADRSGGPRHDLADPRRVPRRALQRRRGAGDAAGRGAHPGSEEAGCEGEGDLRGEGQGGAGSGWAAPAGAEEPVIGANPARRYGSAGSRGLSARPTGRGRGTP